MMKKQYKALKYILDYLKTVDEKKRRKITTYLQTVNTFCKSFKKSKPQLELSSMNGQQLRRIINDAKNSYTHNLEHLVVNWELEENIAGYLHNHLVAKFRDLKKDYDNFA